MPLKWYDPNRGTWTFVPPFERNEVSTSLPPIGAEIEIVKISRSRDERLGSNVLPAIGKHYQDAHGVVIGQVIGSVFGPGITIAVPRLTRDYGWVDAKMDSGYRYNRPNDPYVIITLYRDRGDSWHVVSDSAPPSILKMAGLDSFSIQTVLRQAPTSDTTEPTKTAAAITTEGNNPMFNTDTIETVDGVCGVLRAEIDGKSVIFWQGKPHEEDEETPKDKTVKDVARNEAKKAAREAIKNLVSTLDTPA